MERHSVNESKCTMIVYRAIQGTYTDNTFRPYKNGLPVSKPYVYRGLGYDIYDPDNTGTMYQERSANAR